MQYTYQTIYCEKRKKKYVVECIRIIFWWFLTYKNLLTGLGQCQNSIPRLKLVEDSNAQCAILSCMVLIVLELHKLHAKLKFLGYFLHAKLQNHCETKNYQKLSNIYSETVILISLESKMIFLFHYIVLLQPYIDSGNRQIFEILPYFIYMLYIYTSTLKL